MLSLSNPSLLLLHKTHEKEKIAKGVNIEILDGSGIICGGQYVSPISTLQSPQRTLMDAHSD